jgi:hypothetical protein
VSDERDAGVKPPSGPSAPYVAKDKLGRPIGRAKHFDPFDRDGEAPEIPVNPNERKLLEQRAADREWLRQVAAHFQMVEGARPDSERKERLSRHRREAQWAALRDFPPIPEHSLRELERLIGTYGLPLMELSSTTAAFVVRRVMSDYHRIRQLRRDYTTKALFTPEEMLALLRVLQLRPWQLADMIDPDNQHTVNAAIHRWLSGLHAPTGKSGGGHAFTVARLIEQHVRRPSRGRATPAEPASAPSGAAKRRRKERELAEGLVIPLATSARPRKEAHDAQQGEE